MESRELVALSKVRTLARSGAGRRIRVGAGISQAEIAAACGVSAVAVLRWEKGERAPRGEPALKYAEVLEGLLAR